MREKYADGHIPFKSLQQGNILDVSKSVSNGNEKLEDLMLYCLINGIKTYSCNANKKILDEDAYIVFELNEKNTLIFSHLTSTIMNYLDEMEIIFIKKDNNYLLKFSSHLTSANDLFLNILNKLKEVREKSNLEKNNHLYNKLYSGITNASINLCFCVKKKLKNTEYIIKPILLNNYDKNELNRFYEFMKSFGLEYKRGEYYTTNYNHYIQIVDELTNNFTIIKPKTF